MPCSALTAAYCQHDAASCSLRRCVLVTASVVKGFVVFDQGNASALLSSEQETCRWSLVEHH